jgi:2'-hydroxyisoflavone reductase
MLNRREFLSKTIAAGVGGLLVGKQGSVRAATPLRILILGDAGFIGQHHVAAALARGHKVSVLSRSPTLLPSVVEQLAGDRNADLGSAQDRDWDAVIDTDTHVPFRVRTLGLALKDRVKHYTLISSIDVYDNPGAHSSTDENSAVLEYRDPADPYFIMQAEGRQYGPLGVLCEREAQTQFPERTLIVRPGKTVGPGDPSGAFTYWTVRMEKGGEILAAGSPSARVQMIDARDLADWVIRMAEGTQVGTFNAVGPALPLVWSDMLRTLGDRSSVPVTLTWIPQPWLAEQGVPELSNLRFWPSAAATPGRMRMSNDKARDRRLIFRPLAATAVDTLDWYHRQPRHVQAQLLLGLNGMFSLQASMELEQQLLGAWHASESRKS